ncbi:iron complex outermembrane receptor protein [Chitinophaga skermanii]|uniref:Iron complex outermembrane receptor protein n=1 Tax=Chitinophaga skermanii TaxID=331697 RepID=A0A327QTB9_9BACT|nr:TonB-dependent receptor [Chitinophaga skermanii]RAJ06663.1 iron complex outermembrane receptor protein [Chitinophaga skermanii]
MNKHTLPLLFCFLLATLTSFAQQNGAIRGKITSENGEAAPLVSIQLKNKARGTFTNEKGEFIIRKLTAGEYTLRISLVGYKTEERNVTVQNDQESVLNVTLANDANLSEVEVKGNKQTYKAVDPSPSLRLNQPLQEIPQNIQVVTSKLLADQAIFDMLEGVTRNVSGVTRLEHWDNYANINMRGSQISAFRNGMNVSMPWGPLTEDMSFVERVEFVKGPANYMLASGYPGGMYNVVTKKPTGISQREVTVSVGSFDTYRATIDLDGKLTKNGKLLYRLNVMGQKKGAHRPGEYNDRVSVAPVLTYKFNDKTSITAEYDYQFSKMALIGSAYVFSPKGYGDLPRNFTMYEKNLDPTKINDHSGFLTFNHEFNKNWRFTAQFAIFNSTTFGSSIWPDWQFGVHENGDLIRGVGMWDSRGKNQLGQAFVNGSFKTGALKHNLLGGIDAGKKQYMATWGQGFNLDTATDPFNIYNPHYGVPKSSIPAYDRSKPLKDRASYFADEKYYSFYAQDEIVFWKERARLSVALRYTNFETDAHTVGGTSKDNKVTPRVGLNVEVAKGTNVYGYFDQSFMGQAGIIYPNKPVKPLEGNTFELGVKKDWFGGKWNTTLAAYHITNKGKIIGDPDTTHLPKDAFSLQLGETVAKGIEFDLRGEIVKGLQLTLNYAYTDHEVTEDINPANVGNKIPGYAKHLTNGWLSYRFSKGIFKHLGLSAGYQYQVDRTTWAWSATAKDQLPNYFRVDAGISYAMPKYYVNVNINNIFNKYLYSGAPYGSYYYWQTEPGTNVRATVGYRF